MSKENKILLVDDESDLIKFVKVRLEAEKFSVVVASDGEEALEKVAKENPDLVVLDIMMPKLNGIKVCETIKQGESTSHIPVIMLTGRDSEEEVVLAKKAGANGYMSKPFDGHQLVFNIKELLKAGGK